MANRVIREGPYHQVRVRQWRKNHADNWEEPSGREYKGKGEVSNTGISLRTEGDDSRQVRGGVGMYLEGWGRGMWSVRHVWRGWSMVCLSQRALWAIVKTLAFSTLSEIGSHCRVLRRRMT